MGLAPAAEVVCEVFAGSSGGLGGADEAAVEFTWFRSVGCELLAAVLGRCLLHITHILLAYTYGIR